MNISTAALILFVFLLGAVAGALVTVLVLRQRLGVDQELALAKAKQQQIEEQTAVLQELAARNAEVDHLSSLVSSLQAEVHAAREREQSDNQVLQQLAPVSQTLESLRAKVTTLEEQRAAQHGELVGQLQRSVQAEQQLLHTSQQLARTLSAAGGRGSWGEVSLRRLIEAAGLMQHTDFSEQLTVGGAAGSVQRPDLVVHLPGERVVIIDAKAPLGALLQLPSDASGAMLKKAQQQHAAALKKHMRELAGRDYPRQFGSSLEMVLAFVPSDDLLAHAFAGDPELHSFGYSINVVLVSPATLFAVLKTVENSWRQQAVNEQAKELYDLGAQLYSRLGVMAEKLTKLGGSLTKSVAEYNGLIGTIEQRLLPAARKAAAIDATLLQPAVTELPQQQIAVQPRGTKAPELQPGYADSVNPAD